MLLNVSRPVPKQPAAPALSSTGVCARVSFLVVYLAFSILFAGLPITGQIQGHLAAPDVLQPSPLTVNPEQIFAGLVKHNENRNAKLRSYSAIRTYAVTDTNGKVQAKEIVRMDYVAPDRKAFATIKEEGSSIVRRLVLGRLMESEVVAALGQDHRDSSITPANYRLLVLGEEDLGGHHCLVVEALPKRKDKYLFEGRMWIDSTDFAIVRIAGHPAKNPSFWITRADFVREYEKNGDFWFPAKDETFVDVKLYGKKILTIAHRVDSINGAKSAAGAL